MIRELVEARGISIEAIAGELGLSADDAASKLYGSEQFTIGEVLRLRERFFCEFTLDYLLSDPADTASVPLTVKNAAASGWTREQDGRPADPQLNAKTNSDVERSRKMSSSHSTNTNGTTEKITELISEFLVVLENTPGSAAILSAYVPDLGTFDGLAGGTAKRMMEAFADVVVRTRQQLMQQITEEEADEAMREIFNNALAVPTSDEPPIS